MSTKDITYKQFVAHMDKGNKVYMKKPRVMAKGLVLVGDQKRQMVFK